MGLLLYLLPHLAWSQSLSQVLNLATEVCRLALLTVVGWYQWAGISCPLVSFPKQCAMQQSSHSGSWWPYGLGLFAVLCFAATLPLTEIALSDYTPWFITAIRACIAGVAAIAVLWLSRRPCPTRADWAPLCLSGAALIYGFPLSMAVGLQTVPAAHGGIVLGVLPLCTAALSAWMHGERASAGFWWWSIAGAVVVVVFAARAGLSTVWVGDLWLLIAAGCASYGYVVAADLSRRNPGWWVISWSLVCLLPVGVVATLLFWPNFFWARPLEGQLSLLMLGLFSMYIGFFAWNRALALGGTARVGQIQLMQIFFTLFWAWLLLGTEMGVDVWVFAGAVAFAVFRGKRAAEAA